MDIKIFANSASGKVSYIKYEKNAQSTVNPNKKQSNWEMSKGYEQ